VCVCVCVQLGVEVALPDGKKEIVDVGGDNVVVRLDTTLAAQVSGVWSASVVWTGVECSVEWGGVEASVCCIWVLVCSGVWCIVCSVGEV
jgi:hypothetical protein